MCCTVRRIENRQQEIRSKWLQEPHCQTKDQTTKHPNIHPSILDPGPAACAKRLNNISIFVGLSFWNCHFPREARDLFSVHEPTTTTTTTTKKVTVRGSFCWPQRCHRDAEGFEREFFLAMGSCRDAEDLERQFFLAMGVPP